MNLYTFLTIVGVWLVGLHADAMGFAFLTTLAILHTVTVMQEEQNRHAEEVGEYMDMDTDSDDEVPATTVVTSGPVFPENAVNNQLHFLEEPTCVGVFSYKLRTQSWDWVGEIPYPVGHQPEQVATIVLDKNVA